MARKQGAKIGLVRDAGPAGWSVHPGEILQEEFMKPLGLTSYRLAKNLRIPAQRLNDVVLKKRGISADTAVRLARFFGTSEQFWMNLQDSYDIAAARRRSRQDLKRIAPLRRGSAA